VAGDIPVATIRPGTSGGIGAFYVHADHLNTPRKLTEPSNNATVWRWDSDAFGNGAPDQDPDGNSLQVIYNLRFPGQVYDAVTGLHYNYFRDYDPSTGRYVESDPIGLKGGVNTYGYVLQNPVEWADATGLCVLAGTTGVTKWTEVLGSSRWGPKTVTGIASGTMVVCLWSRTRHFREVRKLKEVWDCWTCKFDECKGQVCSWERRLGKESEESRSRSVVDRRTTPGTNFFTGNNDLETGGTAMCRDPWGGPPARLTAPNP
jgi:RHS repeat-associated protein